MLAQDFDQVAIVPGAGIPNPFGCLLKNQCVKFARHCTAGVDCERCVVGDIVEARALCNDLSAVEVVEQGPLYEMDENGVVWGAEIGEATQSSHGENKSLT